MTERSPLHIIVPVHDGWEVLGACIESLMRTVTAPHRVEFVDDASRDPRVRPAIAAMVGARPDHFALVVQERNLGFVATVNAAMARTRADVVLLNSDTVVTEGWLERLLACRDADPRIATATPFSNNAEICAFPAFCQPNAMPEDPEAIARACREAGLPAYPDLPTGVGFCLYIRRAALDAIGDFDASTFGRGYGEENDFCQRAAGHGWRNVLCDDAYVAHVGNVSFGALGLGPGGCNAARLSARYPDYNQRVAEFISADPLRSRREAILARLAAIAGSP
jgi:GT2 family glycosyltransferase